MLDKKVQHVKDDNFKIILTTTPTFFYFDKLKIFGVYYSQNYE